MNNGSSLAVFVVGALVSGLGLAFFAPFVAVMLAVFAVPMWAFSFINSSKKRQPKAINVSTFTPSLSLEMSHAANSELTRLPKLTAAVDKKQIYDLERFDIPALADFLPSDAYLSHEFKLCESGKWRFQVSAKGSELDFVAVGHGDHPSDAFSQASAALHSQVLFWHLNRKLTSGVCPPTVVIVEDDEDLALVTASVFRDLGCNTIVSNGSDGKLENMTFGKADFVLLDWMLGKEQPAGDLIEKSAQLIDANSKLRQRYSHNAAKVITFSSLNSKDIHMPKSEYFSHTDHWTKPIAKADLERRVSGLLCANGF